MTGAVVIGGDYRALGVTRSLGRRGIPVWVGQDEHALAGRSRYAKRVLKWPESERAQLSLLDDLAAEVPQWTLIPSADETAVLIARHYDRLRTHWVLSTPPWDVLKWGYDKRLTYELAKRLGVPAPWTLRAADRDALGAAEVPFPAILKPAIKFRGNSFSDAKAVKVRNRSELLAAYEHVGKLVPQSTILVQEVIPGSGSSQLSFAGLCRAGKPLVYTGARRIRQFPPEFGKASTYVETGDDFQAEEQSRRILAELQVTGLVEVEFKRDPRDGRAKLLDINLRVWGWHTIGDRAGTDFTWSLWQLLHGEPVDERRASPGARWIRLTTDLPAAYADHRAGRLGISGYLRSLLPPTTHAVAVRDDPIPGILELPLLARLWLQRRRKIGRRALSGSAHLDEGDRYCLR